MHDSLYFSDHHLQVREMVRDFARNVVKPTARQYDLDSRFPWDNVKQMAELGLFGIPWPEELGGSGMDYLSYITVIHELAKVDASHAITVSAHTTLGTSPIMDFGTDEQKQRFVPFLAAGKVLGGFGLTEPGAGSSRRKPCWDRGTTDSDSSCTRAMAAGSASPPCPSVWRRARWRNASPIRRPASSSAGPLRASRACISPSPTWRPRSKPPSSSSITPPGSSSEGLRSRRKRRWQSSMPPSSACARRPRRSSCMGATAIRRSTRSSG